MAPPKRKSGGRTTPKGGTSAQLPTAGNAPVGRASTGSASGGGHVAPSSRYTPPVPRAAKESPRWVPVLMLALLSVGVVLILLRYLAFDDNWPLFAGLAFILGGLYTATRWH